MSEKENKKKDDSWDYSGEDCKKSSSSSSSMMSEVYKKMRVKERSVKRGGKQWTERRKDMVVDGEFLKAAPYIN